MLVRKPWLLRSPRLTTYRSRMTSGAGATAPAPGRNGAAAADAAVDAAADAVDPRPLPALARPLLLVSDLDDTLIPGAYTSAARDAHSLRLRAILEGARRGEGAPRVAVGTPLRSLRGRSPGARAPSPHRPLPARPQATPPESTTPSPLTHPQQPSTPAARCRCLRRPRWPRPTSCRRRTCSSRALARGCTGGRLTEESAATAPTATALQVRAGTGAAIWRGCGRMLAE
jgi:hypothetical protein